MVEAENILATRVTEGESREGSELWGERARLAEVKRRIMARGDAPILDEVNDVKINLFLLREIEKEIDLLKEATIIYNLLAENLWQYKIHVRSGILDVNSDSDSDILEH